MVGLLGTQRRFGVFGVSRQTSVGEHVNSDTAWGCAPGSLLAARPRAKLSRTRSLMETTSLVCGAGFLQRCTSCRVSQVRFGTWWCVGFESPLRSGDAHNHITTVACNEYVCGPMHYGQGHSGWWDYTGFFGEDSCTFVTASVECHVATDSCSNVRVTRPQAKGIGCPCSSCPPNFGFDVASARGLSTNLLNVPGLYAHPLAADHCSAQLTFLVHFFSFSSGWLCLTAVSVPHLLAYAVGFWSTGSHSPTLVKTGPTGQRHISGALFGAHQNTSNH